MREYTNYTLGVSLVSRSGGVDRDGSGLWSRCGFGNYSTVFLCAVRALEVKACVCVLVTVAVGVGVPVWVNWVGNFLTSDRFDLADSESLGKVTVYG